MTDHIIAKSAELSKRYEPRYVIVNKETGEILDDANGYGYKSQKAAHKSRAYKIKAGFIKVNPKKKKTNKINNT